MSCPNCQCEHLDYAGLQWYPLRVFEILGWFPTVHDSQRPDEGALRMYTCQYCETSFVEEALMLAIAGD